MTKLIFCNRKMWVFFRFYCSVFLKCTHIQYLHTSNQNIILQVHPPKYQIISELKRYLPGYFDKYFFTFCTRYVGFKYVCRGWKEIIIPLFSSLTQRSNNGFICSVNLSLFNDIRVLGFMTLTPSQGCIFLFIPQ